MTTQLWDLKSQRRYETLPPRVIHENGLLSPTQQIVFWGKASNMSDADIMRTAGINQTTLERYWNKDIPTRLSEAFTGASSTESRAPALAETYFRFCRELIGSLQESRGPSRGRFALAAMKLFAGRLGAATRAAYPFAYDRYLEAWLDLEPWWRQFEQGQRATGSALHLIGLLTHELANALAMFGRDSEALLFAERSRICYEQLGLSHKPSVRIGLLRSYVVAQQAQAYVGHEVEVGRLTGLIGGGDLGSYGVDHYGLAKSFHFRALIEWFAGRYEHALALARTSLNHAVAIDPAAWQLERLDSRSWHQFALRPRAFIRGADVLWLLRDFGEYGRTWWIAIATATLADIAATYWSLTKADDLRREAMSMYLKNHQTVRAADTLFGAIARMPSANGLYAWLFFEAPFLGVADANTSTYLTHRRDRAREVGLIYYEVLATAALRWYWKTSGDSSAQVDEAGLRKIAQNSHNAQLVDLVNRYPVCFAPPITRLTSPGLGI